MADKLYLKWGTLKGWDAETPEFQAALQKYFDVGTTSISAMLQHDNPAQQEAILEAIEACSGDIINDWSGEKLSKEEARDYIMNYGKD